MRRKLFVRLKPHSAGSQVLGDVEVGQLAQDAGRWEKLPQLAPPARPVAGLLGQLADGRALGRFIRFQRSGRDFPECVADDRPDIPQQADVPGVDQGKDSDGAGVDYDVALNRPAVGQGGCFHRNLDLATSEAYVTRHADSPGILAGNTPAVSAGRPSFAARGLCDCLTSPAMIGS